MIKRGWIIIFVILMYGGCGALFLSFLCNWGKIAIISSIALIILSVVVAYATLRCPHCKKLTIPVKEMLAGLKIGKCTCAHCGEETRVK